MSSEYGVDYYCRKDEACLEVWHAVGLKQRYISNMDDALAHALGQPADFQGLSGLWNARVH